MQSFNKMKILAVDDNRTNLHILQVFLRKLGHEVILAENGEEAVRRFKADSPNLVLMDIMMPVMDGFEAARRIKAMGQERWTPLIFLSALNRDENLVEGLDAGADDYLTKPINFVVLEAKLRSVQRSLAMQQTAIDSLRRVQAVSDNLFDAMITIDRFGIIERVNPAAERMFGWSATDMVGKNINMLMPEPYRSGHDGYLQNYLNGAPPKIIGQEREVQAVRRSGQVFPVSLGITKVILDNQPMFIGLIRDISTQKAVEQKLRDNATQLQAYYDRTHAEQQLAMRLMEKQLHRQELQDKCLHYKVLAAESFSGDIVAAARSPAGRFYVLLADATGHGLTAAISALPVLAIFYRLARNNFPLQPIIVEINHQLRESMPLGRFVAATLVCLDEATMSGEIWVGGTPSVFLLDRWGRPKLTFASEGLPLGIVDNETMDANPVQFRWEPENQLLLFSDGLTEAMDAEGKQFGVDGVLSAAANTAPAERFARIEAALSQHMGNTLPADDVSLMMIDCP